jgi:hypothetical protein
MIEIRIVCTKWFFNYCIEYSRATYQAYLFWLIKPLNSFSWKSNFNFSKWIVMKSDSLIGKLFQSIKKKENLWLLLIIKEVKYNCLHLSLEDIWNLFKKKRQFIYYRSLSSKQAVISYEWIPDQLRGLLSIDLWL